MTITIAIYLKDKLAVVMMYANLIKLGTIKMRVSLTNSALIAIIVTFFLSISAFAGDKNTVTPYNNIVFFGDSLTDNGNMYSVDLGYLPKSPPYYQGRFSNDIVWSERVASHFSTYKVTSDNYAFGGLTAIMHNPINGFLPYTLTGALYDYLVRTVFSDRNKTLFIIWVGGNDYLQGSSNVERDTTDVVDGIKYVIDNLIYYGGTNFLIINLPDLAATPFAKDTGMQKIFKELVKAHNIKLKSMVDELANINKNTNIQLFDSNKFLRHVLTNLDQTNKKYNTQLKNVVDACWQGGYTLAQQDNNVTVDDIQRDIEEYLNTEYKSKTKVAANSRIFNTRGFAEYIVSSPDLLEAYNVSRGANALNTPVKACEKPNEYAFWDRIHPSGPLHMIFATSMTEFISENYRYEIK